MQVKKKKPCNGCNEYVTSDFIMYTGDTDNCTDIQNKARLTDVINRLRAASKKRLAKVTSTSLSIVNDSTNCERGVKIELVPSTQQGNNLKIGTDGKPYVGPVAVDKAAIEDLALVFKKPIAFENQVTAQEMNLAGGINAAFFKVERNGLQTIVPIFRGSYISSDTYYYNDFVSYDGRLWYYHNEQPISGVTPVAGPYWTIVVDKGTPGQDGQPGQPGAPGSIPDYGEQRYAKNTSLTTPPTLVNNVVDPAGWTKLPPATGSGEYVWMTAATKSGTNGNLIGVWSQPIRLTAKDGIDGQDGEDGEDGEDGSPGNDGSPGQNGSNGRDIEYRYAKNGNPSLAPSLNKTETNPAGWALDPPLIGDLEYVWQTNAYKIAGVLQGQWSTPMRYTGLKGADGTNGLGGNAPFKQTVFVRSVTTPATPTGGTWAASVPSGWFDGVPAGTDPIWMSTRIFTNDGTPPHQTSWSAPRLLTSSSTLEVMWSIPGVLTNPGTPASIPANWSTTANTNSVFRAERTVVNGVPGPWAVVRARGEDGQDGDPGGPGGVTPQSKFTSFAFTRVVGTIAPAAPTGGSYTSPNPTTTGWYDSIPAGTGIVYMSSRLFTSDGLSPQAATWSTPRQMNSTIDFFVRFSHVATSPGTPATIPANWHETGDENDIWMATSILRDGVATPWAVVKIKGEGSGNGSGEQGEPGPPGPFGAFRGIWDPFGEYYGSADMIQIVQYPDSFGNYYHTRVDGGGNVPPGTLPTNPTYWVPFQHQFESVATGLLLAKMAVIKNLAVSYLRTGPSPATKNEFSGTVTPGGQGTEHIEIYPSFATLNEYRGQGDSGFEGLTDTDLSNISNTMIFYGRYDYGGRAVTEVENAQLLKIQAISGLTIGQTTITNPDGTTTVIPARTIPGSAVVKQKIVNNSTNAPLFESSLTPAYLEFKTDGVNTKVWIDGVYNRFSGVTQVTDLKADNISSTKVYASEIYTNKLSVTALENDNIIFTPGTRSVYANKQLGILNPDYNMIVVQQQFQLVLVNSGDSNVTISPLNGNHSIFHNGASVSNLVIPARCFKILMGMYTSATTTRYFSNDFN